MLLLAYVAWKALLWSACASGAAMWVGILPVLLITVGLLQGVRGVWALHALRVEDARALASRSPLTG